MRRALHIPNFVLHRGMRDGFTYLGPTTGGPTIESHFADGILQSGHMFVDVGANIGGWSMPASRYYHWVCAFEPTPTTLMILRQNVALNHANNVRIFPYALGDRETDLRLYLGQNIGQNGFFEDHLDRHTVGTVIVRVRPLDVFKLDPTAIKVDTEGFEIPVLKGATETIERCKPRLLIETHRDGDADVIMAMFPGLYDWTRFVKHDQVFLKATAR
jgi:FkbM family methyltransferase